MLASAPAMRWTVRETMKARSLMLALPFVATAAAQGAAAQGADSQPLREVVITATRVEADPFNLPAAISTVSAEQMRGDALGVNLSDDVGTVPGLLARNRNNYAQDQQISIRGIGANSAFGIRGVRVYQDGIPATGPDGQGQVSQFNLDSASRVEILRGPFSALYGNSSGGVIQLFTATGKGPLQVRSAVAYGSFDTLRASLNALGSAGPFGYNLDFSHFKVDGFRDHSSARNESFNGKLNYSINDSNRLALIANVISRPDAQDPLGLTPAEFAANPESTDPAAIRFNTRKSLQQQQGGLIYDLDLTDSQSVQVLGYYGHRSVLQFLSIPQSAQVASGSAGGVVDLNRRYGGADARWSWKGDLAERPMTWVVGLSYDRQNELRRGYNNFIGPQLGVQGLLRRDENDIVHNLDEYAQGTWDFASLWSLMAGVRRSDVKFDSEDHYITATNGNDSGGVTYGATSPVAGLVFKAEEWLRVYASYGQGFQTPIGSELAYRPDGAAGLNLGLQPARSNNTELGVKVGIDPDITAEFAVFQAQTRDEIVVDTNVGGRSTYQNSGRTRRRGAEYSLNYRIAPDWRFQLAYTYVDAYYSDAYLTCVTAPCAIPTVRVAAGNRLPGVPKHNAYASLHWGADHGWHASVSGQYITDVAVNDVNTVFAPAYALMGLDGGYGIELSAFKMSAFLRINNLLNRRYVGSVIVDDGNSRYFEPGPGFNILGGVSVTMK
ncbi:MAG: Iron transporter [Gammaproteobacteria bacterium]|nr:Iron transporter [Gammaproteobacteria bacterium]